MAGGNALYHNWKMKGRPHQLTPCRTAAILARRVPQSSMDIAGFLPTRVGSAGQFASGARRAAAALLAVTACTLSGCGDSPAAPSPTPPVTPRLGVTRFVAFGDSFTEGVVSAPLLLTLTTSYPTRLTSLLQDRYLAQTLAVVNAGLSGEQAGDALPRLRGVLSQHSPEVLLLLEGANDLIWWKTEVPGVRRTAEALEELVNEALRRNVRVFLATLPPWRAGSYRQLDPTRPAQLNVEIDSIARRRGAVLVDLYTAMLPEIDTLIGRDGLHPTEAGYERIAQVFFEVIRATLEVPSPSGASTAER